MAMLNNQRVSLSSWKKMDMNEHRLAQKEKTEKGSWEWGLPR
jgi:hypothetical protein